MIGLHSAAAALQAISKRREKEERGGDPAIPFKGFKIFAFIQ
jgi:hypothetical protein